MLAAFLGGAAGAYGNVALDRYKQQLKEIEERNNEAKEIRLAEARARINEESTRRSRAGTPIYKPERAPGDTDYRALTYGEDGNAVEMRSFGQAPEGILAMEQEQLRQQQEERDRKIRLDEARIRAADARARGVGSGGSGAALLSLQYRMDRDEEQDQKAAIKEAEERALEEGGFFKEKGRWMTMQPVGTRGRTQSAPANPEDISRIRAEARAAVAGELGGSQSIPLPVKPGDPEPPKGTWIQLPDGRVVQHR